MNYRRKCIIFAEKDSAMHIEFEQPYLKELYETGKCKNKKHRFQPEIVKRYISCVQRLHVVARVEDLFAFTALYYEVLQGDKKGIESIRINKQYRLEFKTRSDGDQEPIVTICKILEITNHYQ